MKALYMCPNVSLKGKANSSGIEGSRCYSGYGLVGHA
jgi:hypothetical protein